MKWRGRKALWKLPVLWKNQKAVFPQHLEPSVHSSHNACCWLISKHNFSCTPGDSQPQLGISKAGDRMLRRLLVGSSQYMLGAFGPDSDLRRYGLRLCERGGKNGKKQACGGGSTKAGRHAPSSVGNGDVYEPLHQARETLIKSSLSTRNIDKFV